MVHPSTEQPAIRLALSIPNMAEPSFLVDLGMRVEAVAGQVMTLDRLPGGRAVLGVGLGEPPGEHTSYGDRADRRDLAARLDEGLEVLAGLWSGEPFEHRSDHFTVEDAQFVPRGVKEPRVPVWASCVVQNEATLSRAARWDGVIVASMGEDGSIDPVPVERAAAAIGRLHLLPHPRRPSAMGAQLRGVPPDGRGPPPPR
jgi:alkanesulfonate monooxygenase SsuD/methylene tetrahydromethanopterin reductase-like flavin-dependent oxidoreductase (luciferase family)